MKVYLGYDVREDIVFKVAKDSLQRTTPEAEIRALIQDNLRAWGFYDRPRDERAATDFSLTRFLVPCLMEYAHEWAVFADCDFLFTRNLVRQLVPLLDERHPVYCVHHNYTPRFDSKMDGHVQHRYERKNWSSFMVFNCAHEANRLLTPSVVNAAEPAWLHQMRWCDGYEIGSLPIDFNFLVGEYTPPEDSFGLMRATPVTPTCLHFTNGIGVYKPPVQDYATLWVKAQQNYLEDKRHAEMARRN